MNSIEFAKNWIASWNSHNLDAILSHYSEDIVVTKPMIRLATGKETGTLNGKESVSKYWDLALAKYPYLYFELYEVTQGVNSVCIFYKSVMDKKCIEVMFFNEEGLIDKMIAHYS